jgi:peptidoglycan DL-endopeptidase CwlO
VSSARPRTVPRRAVACGVAVLALLFGVATPAVATPPPSAVEKQIDGAWDKLEPVIEQYNHVHGQLEANQKQVAQLTRQLTPLQKKVDAAMSVVEALATPAYVNGRGSMVDAVLAPGSSTIMVDRITFLDYLAHTREAKVAGAMQLRDRYAAQQQTLQRIQATMKARDADLAARKSDIEAKIADLQKLRIKAYGAAGESDGPLRTGPCPAEYLPDPGGRAAAKACSLIGKPYIWNAAGPRGYDCSGLTLAAWASVGVHLRHYTGWQWADATPVSRDNLRLGDLVFYHSDLHHVALYVGDDTVVEAPHSGARVHMVDMSGPGPIAGYRRPG